MGWRKIIGLSKKKKKDQNNSERADPLSSSQYVSHSSNTFHHANMTQENANNEENVEYFYEEYEEEDDTETETDDDNGNEKRFVELLQNSMGMLNGASNSPQMQMQRGDMDNDDYPDTTNAYNLGATAYTYSTPRNSDFSTLTSSTRGTGGQHATRIITVDGNENGVECVVANPTIETSHQMPDNHAVLQAPQCSNLAQVNHTTSSAAAAAATALSQNYSALTTDISAAINEIDMLKTQLATAQAEITHQAERKWKEGEKIIKESIIPTKQVSFQTPPSPASHSLEPRSEDLKIENEELKEENEFLKGHADALTSDLNDKSGLVSSLQSEIESLRASLEEEKKKEDDVAQEKKQEDELKRIKRHEAEMLDLKSDLENALNLLEETQQELDCANNTVSNLREESDKKEREQIEREIQLQQQKEEEKQNKLKEIEQVLSAVPSEPLVYDLEQRRARSVSPVRSISISSTHAGLTRRLSNHSMSDQSNSAAFSEDMLMLSKKTKRQQELNVSLLARLLRTEQRIQLCCRIRPLLTKSDQEVSVERLSDNQVGCYNFRSKKWQSYEFDKVWGPDVNQQELFEDGPFEAMALNVVKGYNSCILAYGQTGSGKTYTMEGGEDVDDKTKAGMSYRIIEKIFQLVQHTKKKDSVDGKVQVGMIEIYNEEVRDLLAPVSTASVLDSTPRSKSLDIRRNPKDGEIEVISLKRESVSNVNDVRTLLQKGHERRITACTDSNGRSSRSHAIISVRVTLNNSANEGSIHANTTIGNLYLVDLSGSERTVKSNVTGDRLREANHINKSLSALGLVIESLNRQQKQKQQKEQKQAQQHIPYRNSKLTTLLQDCFSLDKNPKTLMILNVCPTIDSLDETTSTLVFGQRAQQITFSSSTNTHGLSSLSLSRLTVQSRNLLEQNKKLSAEVKILMDQMTAKDIEIKKLVQLLSAQERKSSPKSGNPQDMAFKLKKLNEEKTSLARELANAQQELHHYELQLKRVTKERDKFKSQVTELESKLEDLSRRSVPKQVRKNPSKTKHGKSTYKKYSPPSGDTIKTLSTFDSTCTPELNIKQQGKGSTYYDYYEKENSEGKDVDEGKQGGTIEEEDDRSETRALILSILEEHEPNKVDKIDVLMEKFKGNEKSLLIKLHQRYDSSSTLTSSLSMQQKMNALLLLKKQDEEDHQASTVVHQNPRRPSPPFTSEVPPPKEFVQQPSINSIQLDADAEEVLSEKEETKQTLTSVELRNQRAMERHQERMRSMRASKN